MKLDTTVSWFDAVVSAGVVVSIVVVVDEAVVV
jgi:hypothetical protein